MTTKPEVFENVNPTQLPHEIFAPKEMSEFLETLDDHNHEVAGEIVSSTIHLTGHIGVPRTLEYLGTIVAALKGGMVDSVAEANELPTSAQVAARLN